MRAQFGRGDLQALGRAWVKHIRAEAAKDATRSTGVPRDAEFYLSFGYRIEGGTLSIYSTWPWFELVSEGTDGPYRMKWLTRAAGVDRIPIRRDDGTVIWRATPLTTAEAWVHPGIARHTFVQRAYEKAWDEVHGEILARVLGKVFR